MTQKFVTRRPVPLRFKRGDLVQPPAYQEVPRPTFRGFAANARVWYPDGFHPDAGTQSANGDTLYSWPFSRGGVYTGMSVQVTTAAASSARMGIYAANAESRLPEGTPIIEGTGGVSLNSLGLKTVTFPEPWSYDGLDLVWMVFICTFSGVTFRSMAGGCGEVAKYIGAASLTTAPQGSYARGAIYSVPMPEWPDRSIGSSTTSTPIAIVLNSDAP